MLSIINLNALSINDEKWLEEIKIVTKELIFNQKRLLIESDKNLNTLENEVEIGLSLKKEIKDLQDRISKFNRLTNGNIETIAKRVQNILWNYKNVIWKKHRPENPIDILKPNIAIEKLLNYTVIKRDSLGVYNLYGDSVEVAGIIDNNNKAIGISKKFSSEIQNFTMAHELGHALLHKQTMLHRDKVMDGSDNLQKEPVEKQADKFATYFLMPEKQVKKVFEQIFLMEKFVINEDNVFALTGGSVSAFKPGLNNLRNISRFLSSAQSYQGVPFNSIAKVFNVSAEAMAIRLEELGLVEARPDISIELSA